MTRVASHESRVGRGGFTLLEILIVVVIIGILASLVIVGVMAAIRTSRISNTQAFIQSLKGALEQYHVRWHDYPPSTLGGTAGVKLPNDTNNGIESLVASLSSKQRGGVLYQPPTEDRYGNTDNDKLPRNPTDSYIAPTGEFPLYEYMDYFDRPLVYINHDDYAKPPAAILKYVPVPGGDAVEVKVYKSGTTKNYEMPDKYQIYSFGPSGKPGAEDMIPGW